MTIAKNGHRIADLHDWEKRAGPKRADQWRPGRSAMEAARCWLAALPNLPTQIETLLVAHSAFSAIEHWEAEPEARLPFDDFPGEPRNSDLVVHARDRFGDFVLAVEAKADEAFGETVADALASAVERKLENSRSNGVARVEQLAAALLGPRPKRGSQERWPPLGKMRYQLLTATAGALRAGEKRGATRVVFLVQEFRSSLTDDRKHAANAADLGLFVRRLSDGSVSAVQPATLYGPFIVPGAPLFSAPPPLFIGKVCVDLRETTADTSRAVASGKL